MESVDCKAPDNSNLQTEPIDTNNSPESGLSASNGSIPFRDMLWGSPVPTLLVDESSTIVFANPAVQSLTGDRQSLQGASLSYFFLYREELAMVNPLILRAINEGTTERREGFIRTYGPLVWARIHVSPMKLEQRTVAMVVLESVAPEEQSFGTWKSKRLLSMFPMGIAEFSLVEPISPELPDEELISAILHAKVVDGNNEFARIHGSTDIEELLGAGMGDLSPMGDDHTNLYLMWMRKFFPTGSFELRESGPAQKVRFIEKTLIGELENNLMISFWELTRDVTERKLFEQRLQRSVETLKRTLNATVEALVSVAEKRDPFTAGHQKRVAKLAFAMAEKMGLTEDRCNGIHVAASIHDIGKVYVPAEFLTRPGAISQAEHVIIRTHPNVGYDILKNIEFPWPVAEIILQHHERLNGEGYPMGLKGEEILLDAKIVAVADVVEAMSSHRPYRPALGLDMALKEITKNKGSLYDSRTVDACLEVLGSDFNFD
jgi:putative nucleotidyltransferase with HDIG domain/PAS domain S-box-containing protein